MKTRLDEGYDERKPAFSSKQHFGSLESSTTIELTWINPRALEGYSDDVQQMVEPNQ